MSESWIVERGDPALFATLMTGGYLLAAAALSFLPRGSMPREALRLAISLAIVLALLFPVLGPVTLAAGIAAAVAGWAVALTLSGPKLTAAHIVIVAAAATVAALQPEADTWGDYWRDSRDLLAQAGVYAAAYGVVTAPAAYAIGWLMRRPDLRFKDASVTDKSGRGRVIGVLERLILLTLGLSAQWQAIGLVVAAKSIARFRNLEERDFAEYYLIGTLSSLLVALLVAGTARAVT